MHVGRGTMYPGRTPMLRPPSLPRQSLDQFSTHREEKTAPLPKLTRQTQSAPADQHQQQPAPPPVHSPVAFASPSAQFTLPSPVPYRYIVHVRSLATGTPTKLPYSSTLTRQTCLLPLPVHSYIRRCLTVQS
ncbi:hypothetical protein IE81DRAFT_173099 [Ceraceosorus guamensis]|uniref:Uncharacterized protein n=1 Tax=Ceraceosorus guamensis TaxID=1522189 RepID=A0A316VV21_9BASI|nr:hypothetical protein IE81DRAFT_173099 [Ceraceosorus guamensis]PWN41466.1 hypothetical protein IE81DRAFT_173099 [Ceraceosorus guamensis]